MSDVFALVNSMPPPTVDDRLEFLRWYGEPFDAWLCWCSQGEYELSQCGRRALYRVGSMAVCHEHLTALCEDCEVEPTVSLSMLAKRRYNGFKHVQRVRLVPVGRR